MLSGKNDTARNPLKKQKTAIDAQPSLKSAIIDAPNLAMNYNEEREELGAHASVDRVGKVEVSQSSSPSNIQLIVVLDRGPPVSPVPATVAFVVASATAIAAPSVATHAVAYHSRAGARPLQPLSPCYLSRSLRRSLVVDDPNP